MKKLLLLAAMAALALGASADGYKLEKVWERTDVANLFLSGVRQGVGINGKFYINDTEWPTAGGTGEPVFYVYGEQGEPAVYDGFSNTAVGMDQAGHLLVSTASFSANAAGSTIKVLDPNTMEVLAEYEIPEECGLSGRCDFFGIAQGDMTQDGVIYLTGGNTNTEPFTPGVAIMAITDGEVDYDNSYLAPVDGGIYGITSTTISYYKDLQGNDALLYVYRSGAPNKLVLNGNEYSKTGIALPGKGNSNGAFPLVWDGKELFIYPYKGADATNYLDGWAIAEDGAAEPLVAVPSTVTVAANGYQNNWLNAEVDEDGVTIYQYYPGGYLRVYRLTKELPVYTVAANIFNNWEISEENNMTLGEDGCYYLTKENVELTAGTMIEYKVTSDGTWWPADFNAEYYIGEDGIYDLVFVFNPDGGIVGIDVIKHEDPQPEMVYTVVGPAHVFGTEWDCTDTNNDMVKGEDGIYTWTKQGVQLDDFFGFKVVGNHSWDYEWPIGYENNWNAYLPDGAGVYDILITFDPAQPDEKITCTLTKVEVPAGIRGDVNNDGQVNISDVTTLINHVLMNDYTDSDNFSSANADCNKDGKWSIADVTALINFILSKQWPE